MKQAMLVNRVIWIVIVLAVTYAILTQASTVGAKQYSGKVFGYNLDIVSITCIDRGHWQYHNDDKSYCGESIQYTKQATDDTTTALVEPPGHDGDQGSDQQLAHPLGILKHVAKRFPDLHCILRSEQ